MNKFYKTSFIVLTVVISVIFYSRAQTTIAVQDYGSYTYLLHIRYDGTKASINPDSPQPYNVVAGTESQTGPLTGQVYSFDGNKLADFNYDLTTGNNNIYAPYFDNAKTITINIPSVRGSSLNLNVSGSAVCNEDKICNSAAGETYLNCPSDCQAPAPIVKKNIPAQSPQKNSYSNLIWYLVLAIGAIGLVTGVIYFRKREQK